VSIAALLAVAACHIGGSGAMTIPDDAPACTPGAYARLTHAQICTHKDRPGLPESDRRSILARYGLKSWSGQDGELDHRVPFFLGGLTDSANIWPEPGAIPNEKDRLEGYAYRRVCDEPPTLPVRVALRWFRGDWRIPYWRHLT
jgi:hypothetical protein